MSTHPAIIATGIKEPLTTQRVPTATPQQHEIQVRVEWVPSAPLDVFKVDAGLMAQFPLRLGDSVAGTVVAVSPNVQRLKLGDRVCGFVFHNENEMGQQVYVTAPNHLFSKVCTFFWLYCLERKLSYRTGARWHVSCGCSHTSHQFLHGFPFPVRKPEDRPAVASP